jgi:uridine phosphorylase
MGFVPHHLNATEDELSGNGGLGRYLFLPGSDARAELISQRFADRKVSKHPRGHNLYTGTVERDGQTFEVGSISTGMGCPSLDIVVNELFALGGRRFLRVGTSGSLQPERVKTGDVVVATASVRDEHTSRNYVPVEVPAVASLEFTLAAKRAVDALGLGGHAHFGTVHCKDSLFAREFGQGPMASMNREYMSLLEGAGTLASEMESSQLFVLAAVFNQRLAGEGTGPRCRALAGTVLAVIGDDSPFARDVAAKDAVKEAIDLSLETVIQLALQERAELDRGG